MDFNFTDEQQMLYAGARRYVDSDYTFERRQRLAKHDGFARDTWRSFADMGWLVAPIPEEYSGLGLGAVETAIIAEQIGRGLVLEPYTLCGVFSTAVVVHCAAPVQKHALLRSIGSGEQLIAVAHGERESRGRVAYISTTAERAADGGYRLNGLKTVVVGAPAADRLIVAARTADSIEDHTGISLFVVDPKMPGLSLEMVRLMDGTPAADVRLTNARVAPEARLGEEGEAFPGMQRAVDEAIVTLCAEIVGGMEDVISLCSEYLKTRKQFGVTIGSFQALQHRMADMAIELLQARATLHRGLAALVDTELKGVSSVVSGCKAQVMRSAKFVTAQGIQLHGAYGLAEEYRVGHHFRRLVLADAWFGNMEYHLNCYARLIQSEAAALQG